MVAPAARVFLRAVRAALTSTVPDLLCLLARGSPRGLASGRLPLAALDSSLGFVLSKHWGDDCYLTNRLWQDLKAPGHLGKGQELRLAPPVQWALQVQGNQLQTAVMAPPEPAGRV
uniref:IRX2 divergent transcript n=1 Tax=Nomascus leucogenys TaxID=61853 RepID=A0A2I3GST6_NOMLE